MEAIFHFVTPFHESNRFNNADQLRSSHDPNRVSQSMPNTISSLFGSVLILQSAFLISKREELQLENLKYVGGFSDLKQLLIRTFKITRDPIRVRLYFSIEAQALRMHDYDFHQNMIQICSNIQKREVRPDGLTERSRLLILEALEDTDPALSLNNGFLLHGTFLL